MAILIADFRAKMPAFADAAKFPDAVVQMYLDLAAVALDPARWGQFFDLGQRLFVAHWLSLDAANTKAAAGGIPGQSGVTASKSVGSVSVSYDNTVGRDPKNAAWNLTTYGSQFATFARMAGAGPQQVI